MFALTPRVWFSVSAAVIAFAGVGRAQQPTAPSAALPRPPAMILTSPAFPDGGAIPLKYTTADAAPVAPRLEWTNVPPGTESFALLLFDPEVVREKAITDVLHWLVFNIPGTARELPENVPRLAQLADGTIQGNNDKGTPGFLGLGAPSTGPPHHYTFLLFALDQKISLEPGASRTDLMAAMAGHMLAKGVLVGRFARPRN